MQPLDDLRDILSDQPSVQLTVDMTDPGLNDMITLTPSLSQNPAVLDILDGFTVYDTQDHSAALNDLLSLFDRQPLDSDNGTAGYTYLNHQRGLVYDEPVNLAAEDQLPILVKRSKEIEITDPFQTGSW